MKKAMVLLPLLLLLSGCGGESYETVSDVPVQPVRTAAQIQLALPEDSSVVAVSNAADGTVYLCDGYCVTVSTHGAGDLDATLRLATGFSRAQLPLLERQEGANRRYECAWAAAGEGEDQIGRAVILDDGSFHYVLTVMGEADRAGELTQVWQEILASFKLRIAA